MKVRPATREDVIYLAPRLREADLREIEAGESDSPLESLMRGLDEGDACYVCTDDEDNAQIIFGVMPSDIEFMGFIWMVASDALTDHWMWVLRNTKPCIEMLPSHYQLFTNAVHADNEVHIRWLRWAGFTFLRTVEVNGHLFHEFAKIMHRGKSNV
ncbi:MULTISPECIES: hypothetical protein [unclassified Thioalkalivibrio]|uniref:hypothetical protein n=1 Tax=unclassified Thioalkalivibrio TaxID=2621013 RepID=UPI00036A9574|nr:MULTISPECIES: hypothetical protein [unclassified Thioalkalivibrio]